MSHWKSGTTGWVCISLFVLAWDVEVALRHEGETLTNAFRRATRHPLSRWPVVLLWSVTTAHLYGWLPPQADPFQVLTRLAVKQVEA